MQNFSSINPVEYLRDLVKERDTTSTIIIELIFEFGDFWMTLAVKFVHFYGGRSLKNDLQLHLNGQ